MARTFSSQADKQEWETGAAQKLVELEKAATQKYDFYRLPTLVGIRVATDKNLSPTALRLWVYLCSMFPFGDIEQYMPTQAELAARLGVSRRSILRAAAELEEFDLWEFKVERWKGRNLTGHNAPSVSVPNVTPGDTDVTRGDKKVTPGDTDVTRGDKKEQLPIYKDRARDQTYSDSDQTFKQTYSDLPPNPLKKGECESEPISVEVEVLNSDKEGKTLATDFDEKEQNALIVANKTSPKPQNSLGGCDNKGSRRQKTTKRRLTDKLTDLELEHWVNAWSAEKPSTFVQHERDSFQKDPYIKIINKLINDYGENSITMLTAALTWCREEEGDFWRREGFSFSLKNLSSNGKIPDLAKKHFHAMERDRAYRDRVEGKAPSRDSKRRNGFVIINNETGEELTGASAAAAAAVADDPILQFMLGMRSELPC